MRPIIKSSRNIRKTVMYNENKRAQHQAECIYAGNYLQPAADLPLEEKLRRFQERAALNTRVATCQHITLNFHPNDQLSNETMQQIARRYMKEIGFKDQPYLVYRHNDAGHPHCHLVTTHITPNGDPLDLYNIGKDRSEKARETIEKEFNLTPGIKDAKKAPRKTPESIRYWQYGKDPTTAQMSYKIERVYPHYIYTNLEEYNVALKTFRIEACPCRPNPDHPERQGLLYRRLDKEGHYIGRPIPAGDFDFKPTLENLEQKFAENKALRLNERTLIYSTCDRSASKPITYEDLEKDLKHYHVAILPQKDANGKCQEIYFIQYHDAYRKNVVFTGSELGPKTSPEFIQQIIDQSPEVLRLREEEEKLHPRQSQRQRMRVW